MASNNTAIELAQPRGELAKPETFAPRTLSEALDFAKMVLESGFAPKAYTKSPPSAIVIALQYGMEVGLQPMQALQSIACINGQPSLWGDGMLALVMSSPVYEWHKEEDFETIKKQGFARCIVKRRGAPEPVSRTFSMEDAKNAGLLNKESPWKTYPARMLQMRARAFCLRDVFPDVIKGLISAEEAQDYPGTTIDAAPADSKPTGKIDVKAEPPAQAQTEEVIGKEAATEFYKVYKAHGWTPEESRTFIKGTFGIEPPKTSADIPKSRLKEAMDWASMNAPIRDEANQLFEQLGWTTDEKQAFVNEQKWNWPSIVAALKAEIQKRNQNEQ